MDTKLKYISLTVLFAVILTFVVVFGLMFSTAYLPSTTRKDEICMSNKDEEVVCGSNENILHHYLDKIISKEYIELKRADTIRNQKNLDDNKEYLRSLDKDTWETKPAARITGKEQHEERKDEGVTGMQPLTDNEWTYGRELHDSNGFLSNGVRYWNGRLVVPVDGTYSVYSIVDFFEACDPSTGKSTVKDLNNPIKHSIYKFSILDQAEIEIIANVQPRQISSNKHYNSYSSYVSAVASLKAGDEVLVKRGNPDSFKCIAIFIFIFISIMASTITNVKQGGILGENMKDVVSGFDFDKQTMQSDVRFNIARGGRATFPHKKKLYTSLLFTTGVELIALLALIGCWYSSRFGQWDKMDTLESELCLPMHKFVTVTDDNSHRICPVGLKEHISINTEGTKSCCGPMSVVLRNFTAKIVDGRYDSDAFPEIAALDITAFGCSKKETKPLKSHLVGISSMKHQVQIEVTSKLFWNSGRPSSTDTGLNYLLENGTIYIERSGHFHISSQLRSKIQNTNCTNEVKCKNFKHFVHRILKNGKEQILLEGGNPVCKLASEVSEFTSAVGAVFKLETGDKLYVSTSHPDSVLSDLNDNYFSVYSI